MTVYINPQKQQHEGETWQILHFWEDMEWATICSYGSTSNRKKVKTHTLSIKPEAEKAEAEKVQKRISREDYHDENPQGKSTKAFPACTCSLITLIVFCLFVLLT